MVGAGSRTPSVERMFTTRLLSLAFFHASTRVINELKQTKQNGIDVQVCSHRNIQPEQNT